MKVKLGSVPIGAFAIGVAFFEWGRNLKIIIWGFLLLVIVFGTGVYGLAGKDQHIFISGRDRTVPAANSIKGATATPQLIPRGYQPSITPLGSVVP